MYRIYAPKGAFLFVVMKNFNFILLLLLLNPSLLTAQDPSLAAKIRYNEALALVIDGNCAQALLLFTEAITLDHSNPKIHYMRGYCENKLNQVQGALASFQKARELAFSQNQSELLSQANRSIYNAQIRLAAFALQDGDAAKVLRYLEAAEQFRTEETEALVHYYYAAAYNATREYSKALIHAKEATKRLAFASGERYAPYFYELGYALEFTGQMSDAVRAYERAEQRIANIRELYLVY
jgi:tetratricopeptide (TPR) repeat protein